ncbi:G-protein coupled receptor dmsr-1-like [Ruditapes philippinarum]|uniref:G-protein coupled receptor dmsr-1-like n=1 Tax=Ruditapes philippinarum TaxID=129788 RepID=UPI00295B47B1|nr:G-protein coupled receptor dmsr-1-like [Ruditapes philippinarum]XP_060593821.1 G-protein coupled receptor dmsr-1-like [Ruditapes philippinarum]
MGSPEYTTYPISVNTILGNTSDSFMHIENVTDSATQDVSDLMKFQEKYARIHGYVSVCVCLFGFLANIANIVVLTRKNMITSTNVILTWLAVADLFTMLDYFPFAMHFYILKDQDLQFPRTRGYGWIIYLLFHANFSVVCHSCAIWLTIALATFRFVCIWFPTRGSTYCTVMKARLCAAIIFCSVVILCVPNMIINDMATTKSNVSDGNITKQDTVYDAVYREGGAYLHIDKLNKMIQAILFKILPCFLLTVLTILLVVAMHRAYKRRMALKNQGRREESDRHGEHNRTTVMLLAVVVLFLLTELPQGILTIMGLIEEKFFLNVYQPLGDILDIMALCNNAINFVLYCTMSRQFRDTFVSTFCWFCPKSKPGWMKMKLVNSKATQNGNTMMTEHTHV